MQKNPNICLICFDDIIDNAITPKTNSCTCKLYFHNACYVLIENIWDCLICRTKKTQTEEQREVEVYSYDTINLDIPDLYENLEPKKGGLIDPRIGGGAVNYSDCTICGISSFLCVDHFHLDFMEEDQLLQSFIHIVPL